MARGQDLGQDPGCIAQFISRRGSSSCDIARHASEPCRPCANSRSAVGLSCSGNELQNEIALAYAEIARMRSSEYISNISTVQPPTPLIETSSAISASSSIRSVMALLAHAVIRAGATSRSISARLRWMPQR
jgi:hypothetical protein